MSGNESIAAAHYDQVTTWLGTGYRQILSILVLALFIADTRLSTRISLINFRTPAGGSLRSTCLVMLN